MTDAKSILRSLGDLPRPKVIGHRGLPSRFPENTISSYEAAIAAGADMVELDFYCTADGALVCIHDPTLNRYLAAEAPVSLADRPIRSFSVSATARPSASRHAARSASSAGGCDVSPR